MSQTVFALRNVKRVQNQIFLLDNGQIGTETRSKHNTFSTKVLFLNSEKKYKENKNLRFCLKVV